MGLKLIHVHLSPELHEIRTIHSSACCCFASVKLLHALVNKTCDMMLFCSPRNIFILGFGLYSGLAIPYWFTTYQTVRCASTSTV